MNDARFIGVKIISPTKDEATRAFHFRKLV